MYKISITELKGIIKVLNTEPTGPIPRREEVNQYKKRKKLAAKIKKNYNL